MVVPMRLRGLTAASLICIARASDAQVVTPGMAEDFLRETPRITPSTPPAPLIRPRTDTPSRLRAQVQVSAITFGETSLYTKAELQAIAQPYLKPRMSLAEIQEIAQHITERMRSDGYLLASAILPAQKVNEGVVRIDILEGKLESVRFSGNGRYSEAFLKPYLDPLTGAPALTTAGLERGLLLLNELPGASARGTLSPGGNRGGASLDVEVGETRYKAAAGVNNYGSRELGRVRSDLALDIYNPLRLGDHANLRLINSSGGLLGLGRIAYDLALAPGWRASFAVARVDYRVGGALSALELAGNSLTRDANLSYALVRTRTINLTWVAGVRDVRTDQRALGQSLGGANVRVGYTSLTGYTSYGGGITSGIATFASNGKSEPGPGTAGNGVRLKSEFDITHARPLPGDFEISQRVALALSPDTLPDTEKFSIGGPDSVRAFPIAQLRGDQGLLSVTELRRRFKVAGAQAYIGVFFDHGIVQVRQPGLPASRDSLSGAGITLGATHDKLRLKLDLARQSGSDSAADGRRNRLWISATWLF